MAIRSNPLREIEKIARSLNIIYSKKFRELNIQRGKYTYIIFVNENPGLSQLDMVNKTNIDKTTVTKALNKLEIENIIFRQKDTDDKRILRIYPTQLGRDIYKKILIEENRLIDVLFSSFSDKNKVFFETYLSKIGKDIEREWKTTRNYLSIGTIKKASIYDLDSFDQIKDFKLDHYYYTYNYKDKVVGYIDLSIGDYKDLLNVNWTLNKPALILENIFISENNRGKGFGYELMKVMNSLGSSMGVEYHRAIVEENNIPMLKLINIFEFRFVGEYIKESNSFYCFERKTS